MINSERTPQNPKAKRPRNKKVKKPIRRVSPKQAKELARRTELKAELIGIYGKVCMTCGNVYLDWRGISLSHVISLSRHGMTHRGNCLLECYPCHEKYEKKPELRPRWIYDTFLKPYLDGLTEASNIYIILDRLK